MTRTVWVVMACLAVGLGVASAIINAGQGHTVPQQELARAVLVPTVDAERQVIVPPCGTGTDVAALAPETLAKTPGTTTFLLQKGRGDRIVVVPRCRASQGAHPSEGAELPSSAFVLPIGARITAGRAGSAEAGTEKVQSQLVVPPRSGIETVVVTPCIQPKKEALTSATGRALILDPQRGRPTSALGPPC